MLGSVHMIDAENAERKKRETWLSENKNMRGTSSDMSANQLWNQYVCKLTETSCRACPRCTAKTKLNEEKISAFFGCVPGAVHARTRKFTSYFHVLLQLQRFHRHTVRQERLDIHNFHPWTCWNVSVVYVYSWLSARICFRAVRSCRLDCGRRQRWLHSPFVPCDFFVSGRRGRF